ncbi:PspC domain-containing protein [Pullulanibacillus sp. KACC 23026]|uniref:PspC domain-containing protein n=1 Tax=Pullulanibacillus sp. KACC 23026 TaxID=3028315 RepID=UPI0023B1ECE9|nr:PspC domain-containing protein [Pullulanibacillus sp. KACC 23026]WEG13608.1 PspC domain-containing protein [Pullulanibacillus sp. KACC 23026]
MKRLYRSRKQKMVAGICGGVADYFKVDVTLIRVIYAALCLFSFFVPCILLYIVLYFIIPEADEWES